MLLSKVFHVENIVIESVPYRKCKRTFYIEQMFLSKFLNVGLCQSQKKKKSDYVVAIKTMNFFLQFVSRI